MERMTRSEFLAWLKGKRPGKAVLGWARGTPGEPEALWNAFSDGGWMLWVAGKAGVERRLLVQAACACARGVVERVPAGEDRPRRALEAAEAWTRGEVGLEAVQKASDAACAYYTSVAAQRGAYAACAAAHGVWFVDPYTSWSDDACIAAIVRRDTAGLVRARLPWATIEAAIRGA